MLTAHLPSGYLIGRAVRGRAVPYLMPAALIGAVLPDFDMLWFLFVDMGAVHHHHYWPHIPMVWLIIALIALPILRRFGLFATGLVFFAAILLHLVLDTIAGGINWGWPFGDTLFVLFVVPARYSNWVISFMLHWTFALELAIWAAAAWVYFGKKVA